MVFRPWKVLSMILVILGCAFASNPIDVNEEKITEKLEPNLQPRETSEIEKGNLLFQKGFDLLTSSHSQSFQYLKEAADLKNKDALWILGNSYLFGKNGAKIDTEAAFQYFISLANLGNSSAQSLVGTMYSQGIGVEIDQGRAFLYHSFASIANEEPSLMSLAYRRLHGIGTGKSCETAAQYYQLVAAKVVEKFKRIASKSLTKEKLTSQVVLRHAKEDVLQYYQYSAEAGDVSSRLTLGQLYLQGGHGITQDFALAFQHLKQAADLGNAQAQGLTGFLYLEGEGTEKNEQKAFEYFQSGASKGDPTSMNGMGLVYLQGIQVKQDLKLAFAYFEKAAEKSNADAMVNLGLMFYNGLTVAEDYAIALKHFTAASQQGHLLGQYYLGVMHLHGSGIVASRKSCPLAVSFLKVVAERGSHARIIEEAHLDYTQNLLESATLKYLIAAEQGHEVAQENSAFLLEKGSLQLPEKKKYQMAFLNWFRASSQGSVEARIRVGDYYYYGWGVDVDYAKAASYYTMAEQMNSAQAMFNLGYMHENGLGIAKDLHLAKRFYDKAMMTAEEASIPASLALLNLGFKFLLNGELGTFINPETLSPIPPTEIDFTTLYKDWETVLIVALCILLGLLIAFRQLRY